MHFHRSVHRGKCTRMNRGGSHVTRSSERVTRNARTISRTKGSYPKNWLRIGPNSRYSLTKLFVLRDSIAKQLCNPLLHFDALSCRLIISFEVSFHCCKCGGKNANCDQSASYYRGREWVIFLEICIRRMEQSCDKIFYAGSKSNFECFENEFLDELNRSE